MANNITTFQLMRRRLAEKQAKEAELQAQQDDGKQQDKEQAKAAELEAQVEALTVEEIRTKLVEMGVSFQPNTGEVKLRAKLLEALKNGVE